MESGSGPKIFSNLIIRLLFYDFLMNFIINFFSHFQIVEKILLTHLVMEPFAIGIYRCLSQSHPVQKLLCHHLRFICGGNAVLRLQLLAPGGALDRLMSYGEQKLCLLLL